MAGHGGGKNIFETWLSWDGWISWIGDWGISRALFLWVIYLGLFSVLAFQIPNLFFFLTLWLAATAPIWIPLMLIRSGWFAWVHYIQHLYLEHQTPILLEIKIPREVMKSPRAMELVFNSFYVTSGEVTFIVRAWKGSVRPWWSFEMASFGGEIHFYVWCWKSYRRFVETNIYAQYPEVEIFEVEDYASKFAYDPAKHFVFATNYSYHPDQIDVGGHKIDNVFPIKSYIDFELDDDPKEEFKVEPLASVFEVLSALKPDEQAWIQMAFRVEGKRHGPLFPHPSHWKDNVNDIVKKIRREASLNPGMEDAPEDDEKKYGFPRPTWIQTQQIEILQRHLGKVPFEVGMRGCYITSGKPDGTMYTAIRWIWKPFNSPNMLNILRPKHWHNDYDYPWQDIDGIRWNSHVRRFIDAYRSRSYFYPPWEMPTQVMTPEIMATIYHFPSSTVKSPGLQRIAAKKGSAPHNLPFN